MNVLSVATVHYDIQLDKDITVVERELIRIENHPQDGPLIHTHPLPIHFKLSNADFSRIVRMGLVDKLQHYMMANACDGFTQALFSGADFCLAENLNGAGVRITLPDGTDVSLHLWCHAEEDTFNPAQVREM